MASVARVDVRDDGVHVTAFLRLPSTSTDVSSMRLRSALRAVMRLLTNCFPIRVPAPASGGAGQPGAMGARHAECALRGRDFESARQAPSWRSGPKLWRTTA